MQLAHTQTKGFRDTPISMQHATGGTLHSLKGHSKTRGPRC